MVGDKQPVIDRGSSAKGRVSQMVVAVDRFRNVKIGQWFDFIGPDHGLVTFWTRVQKTGARTYEDESGLTYRIGSLNARVYHIAESARLYVVLGE